MGKVVVTSFITLDGVMEAPETWSFPFWNKRIERFKNEELEATSAQLLGRVTYQTFAEAWPTRSGAYADRLNASEKYVVSTSLRDATWNNSRLIAGFDDLRSELPDLKARHEGHLLVHGSRTLVTSLVQHDLVDTYHLLVYPLAIGQGKRLFADGVKATLKLASSTDMGGGAVLLIYQRDDS